MDDMLPISSGTPRADQLGLGLVVSQRHSNVSSDLTPAPVLPGPPSPDEQDVPTSPPQVGLPSSTVDELELSPQVDVPPSVFDKLGQPL